MLLCLREHKHACGNACLALLLIGEVTAEKQGINMSLRFTGYSRHVRHSVCWAFYRHDLLSSSQQCMAHKQ